MNAPADRNLLFGIVALQMEFIDREALISAMNAWVLEKTKPLGQILVAQNALSKQRHDLLESLVKEHLKQHDGDPQRSLESIGSPKAVRAELARLPDADVQASLAHVPAEKNEGEGKALLQRTMPLSMLLTAGSRFRFLRPWREGGLGKVSIARDEELHREVALKEIKPQHAGNKHSRERFLLEAEITGSLEHPGIVPVYGMGKYGDGRPYYAMRFVRGDSLEEAINQFHYGVSGNGSGAPKASADEPATARQKAKTADKNLKAKNRTGRRAVAFRELLGRFIDVCNAVAYAHSRGVLHRDIKPANIILGKYGETLVVDWGLAKVRAGKEIAIPCLDETPLQPHLGNGSAPTRMGALIGTPMYMSPEQAAGRLDLLGPASDVYSLGATLYELLTGQPPCKDTEVATILQNVKKGNFPRPRQANKEIAPALEAICLKAMALKAEDRYPGPTVLADDLEHWLADEPVGCYREPLRNRLARWARRHRGLAQATILALFIITIASLVAAALIGKAQQVAVRESKSSQRVASLLVELFRGSDPLGMAGTGGSRFNRSDVDIRKITGLQLLDRGVDRIRKNLAEELEVRARLLDTIGSVYSQLGLFGKASEILQEVVDVRRQQMGQSEDNLELLTSMQNLAYALQFDGKWKQAELLYREVLAQRKKILGEKNMDVSNTMFFLSSLLSQCGEFTEAEMLFKQVIDIRTELEGIDAQSVAVANAGMAGLKLRQDDFDGASRYLTEAAVNFKNFKEAQPGMIISDYQRALQLAGQGRTKEAVPLMEKTLERVKVLLGPDHPFVAWVLAEYGKCLMEDGQFAAAEKPLLDSLELSKETVGLKHYNVSTLRIMLAQLYCELDRYGDADAFLRENLRVAEENSGHQSDEYALALNDLASLQSDTDVEQAKATLREALQIAKLRGFSPATATLVSHYAHLTENEGPDLRAAQRFLEDEIAAARLAEPRSFAIGLLQRELGFIYYRQKRFNEAQITLTAACDILADTLHGSRQNLARAKSLLGATLLALGKPDDAEPPLVLAWGWFKSKGNTDWARDSLRWLIALREQQNQEEELRPLREQLQRWQERSGSNESGAAQPPAATN